VPNALHYAAREWDADAGVYYIRAPAGTTHSCSASPGQDPIGYTCDWWGMPVSNFTDMRAELARKCTWHFHCPGEEDLVPPECKRVSPPGGECKLFTPDERDWAEVGVRIRRMRSTPQECAGAKAIMLNYYAAGSKSGGINFWNGNRLRYNSDGSFMLNPDGSYATIVGHPVENGVAYNRRVFFQSQRAVAHEPLHLFYDEHPELTRGVSNIESFIGQRDRRCGGD
jgi:hypothetical protein